MKNLGLALALLTTGMAAAQTAYPVTIQHMAGKTTITKRPLRVVALQEEAGELAQALDIQLVGFAGRLTVPTSTRFTQHGYLNMTKLGQPASLGYGKQPSLEVLAALKPDLIVGTNAPALMTLYPQLSKIAPTLLWSFNADPVNTWRGPLRETAKALGKSSTAEKSIAQIDLTLNHLRSELAPEAKKYPRVTPIYIDGQDAMAIFNSSAFAKMLKRIGFTPAEPRGLKSNLPYAGGVEISGEALTNLPSDWVLITRAQEDGKFQTDTVFDKVLKQQKAKTIDLHLPPDISVAGPVLDVYYAQAIAHALQSTPLK